tara:strand:+ start:452 stop:3133 length:2682 start_codon:yes stop_codon:yes gene_type:complete
MKKIILKSWGLGIALGFLLGLISPEIQADYIYEANQDLYDLTNHSGTTNLAVGDDLVSAQFNFGFDFTYYDNTFTFARMATNGCLHFGLTSTSYNDYCGDYTPDPLPQYPNTLFPFWTDLIRDGGSKMLAKNILDSNNDDLYTIFGWYNLREYNQSGTDNSIEVWLYPNNTFEYRYGGLDIDNHDVLIGEQGPTTSDIYTYLFFDKCNTGTTNSSTCVSYDWNSSQNTTNTLLEGGGSLYGVGTGNALDCSSALNNAACPGYAAAYLAQQCNLNSLYSETCSGYSNAYDDQQCGLDSQYAPFCAGYTQEASVAYFDTETDYGYDDTYANDQYGYDDNYSEDNYYEDDYYEETYEDEQYADNCIDNPDWCYEDDPYWDQEFTDEEWYEIDLEEFGQVQVDEWYGTEVAFSDEGFIDWDSSELNTWEDLDAQFEEYDAVQEEYQEEYYEEEYLVDTYEEEVYWEETYYEEEVFLYEETYDTITYVDDSLVVEFERQLVLVENEYWEEEAEWEEFETMEELDEWYEEEMEEEWVEEYAELEELIEEIDEIDEIEEILLAEEEIEEIEIEEEVTLASNEDEKSDTRSEQLNVVASTIQTATNSVSGTTAGTTSGTSIHATGSSTASGGSGVGSTVVSGASSSITSAVANTGGISTSSSPSISDQFASSSAQTQQVLAMSPSTAVSSDFASAGTDFSTETTSVVSTSTIDMGTSSGETETVASVETTATADTDSVETVASVSSDTSGSSSSTTEVTVTSMSGMGGQSQVAMVDVQVQGVTSEIDTATTGVMTASEADQIADQIIADNIEEQQQQVAASAEESGEYGDQTALVAYIGFNPNFTDYYSQVLPQKTDWYEPRAIYADVSISDNVSAFYDMAGTSLRTLRGMINSQPNLLGE